MPEQPLILKFKISYQNGVADQHHLDMYDAAISYLGFSKALNITIDAILNKRVKLKGHKNSGFEVYLETSKVGSFEQIVTVVLNNPEVSSIVLGASGSALWDGIKYVWGGLLNQYQKEPKKVVWERIEPILGDLHQALESPFQSAHRPILSDEDITIDISCGRKSCVIKLDYKTLQIVSEKTTEKIEEKTGNITKYNTLTYIGKFYDEDQEGTVSFHAEALSKYEQELLTWSMHECNKDITKGKLEIQAIPIRTPAGKLKRYDFVDVKKLNNT